MTKYEPPLPSGMGEARAAFPRLVPKTDEIRVQSLPEVLTELVTALTGRAPDALDPVFAPLYRAAPDDSARLRVIIDQVASLTDPAALAWHHRVVGS